MKPVGGHAPFKTKIHGLCDDILEDIEAEAIKAMLSLALHKRQAS